MTTISRSLRVIRLKGGDNFCYPLYNARMTYSDGAWGAKAKQRSQNRKEYFKQYKSKHAKSKNAKSDFKPRGCIKRNARQRVRDHVLAGKMVKPAECEHCSAGGKLEAHHHDYSKPLEVVWLCKPCHVKADEKVRQT